jgi:hypothetical protein
MGIPARSCSEGEGGKKIRAIALASPAPAETLLSRMTPEPVAYTGICPNQVVIPAAITIASRNQQKINKGDARTRGRKEYLVMIL